MATTFTLLKATPYSVAYTVTGDGNPGSRTGAAILADLPKGPLKVALARKLSVGSGGTGAADAMSDFNIDSAASPFVRTRLNVGINAAQTLPAGIQLAWVVDGLSATLTNLSAINIEIRLQHSVDR